MTSQRHRLMIVGGSDAGIAAGMRAHQLDPSIERLVVVADRYRTAAPALPMTWEHVQVEVDVVDLEPSHLGEAVSIRAVDRRVTAVSEALAGACLEERTELVVGQHGRRLLGHLRRSHLRHRLTFSLPSSSSQRKNRRSERYREAAVPGDQRSSMCASQASMCWRSTAPASTGSSWSTKPRIELQRGFLVGLDGAR